MSTMKKYLLLRERHALALRSGAHEEVEKLEKELDRLWSRLSLSEQSSVDTQPRCIIPFSDPT